VLDRLLHRFHRLDSDELRQRLRAKLFVGDDARIREYVGLGFLGNWFKVIAARTFLADARAAGREPVEPLPDDFDAAGDADDPRQAAVRAQVVAEVKRALDAAISAMPPRERTYLRHVIVDGLKQDQIAATYGDIARIRVGLTRVTVISAPELAHAVLVEKSDAFKKGHGIRIFGKPVDEAECLDMLGTLAGRTHAVHTAVALWHDGRLRQTLDTSYVTFRDIDVAERRRYWQSGEPAGKAGGYAIQGLGAVFVTRLEGSFSGVMGLPLAETAALLDAAGVRRWQLA
jgi:DNA-directed RNA polymerase specialized sigma24 family protein